MDRPIRYFVEGSAAGLGDLLLRTKATLMKENTRAFAAGLDLRLPTGDELNLLGSGAAGIRPFAAFSTTIGRFDPHFNLAYQWNGHSLLAGDVESQIEADLPDQFQYAIGTDLQVNSRFSIVFDVLGQRLMNASRLSTYEFQATGVAGTVALPDIRFATDSYWVADGAIGFKANVATRVLVNFNLRFSIGQTGLSDRIAPLLGVEWAF